MAGLWKQVDVKWSRAGVGREKLTNRFFAVCPKIEVAVEGDTMEEAAKALDKAVGAYLGGEPLPPDPRRQILDAILEMNKELLLTSAKTPGQFIAIASEQKRLRARARKYTVILLRKEIMLRLGKKVSNYTQWKQDVVNEWIERVVTRDIAAHYLDKNGTTSIIPDEIVRMAEIISERLQERFRPAGPEGYRTAEED